MRLELQRVSVALEDARLIDSVDLCCESGEFVGLLGPNGSGKSTALRTIYRAIRPSEGVVRLGGRDVHRDLSSRASARSIAAMTQERSDDFAFTVGEVVLAGRVPHKSGWSADTEFDRAVVEESLDRVGLLAHRHRLFAGLSGGEKQRALLARALAQQPKVLVLDEPTNHLDISTQLELLALIASLGVTVLAALHDLNLAAAYCDRIYVLRDGVVVAGGRTSEVLTAALIADVFGVHAECGVHPITGGLHLAFSPLSSTPHRTLSKGSA